MRMGQGKGNVGVAMSSEPFVDFLTLWARAEALAAYLDNIAVPIVIRERRLPEYVAMLEELAWCEESGVADRERKRAAREGA